MLIPLKQEQFQLFSPLNLHHIIYTYLHKLYLLLLLISLYYYIFFFAVFDFMPYF